MKRRDFLAGMAVTSAALATGQNQPIQTQSPYKMVPRAQNPKNIIICAANGYNYIDRGYEKLRQGADTLDAALAVVSGPEDDPNDDSVGLGGLPNEEGVVELDSCLMHGPTRRAGAVGALHDIKNASAVAKAVMEHTGHVMLVGEGATRFGLDMGFPKENLLTEHSRKIWMLWKEAHSNQDWWGPGMGDPGWKPPAPLNTAVLKQQPRQIQKMYAAAADLGIPEQDRRDAIYKVLYPPTGTINCSVLNEKGEMSSVTTTSGLAWKIPGRCGDSPIIGAGCYCDQEVGAAGATGNGEENIKVAGAHTIVENMRHGMSPEEAGMDALRRVAHIYNNDMTKLAYVSMFYYVLRRDGAYAGVSLWGQPGPGQHPRQFAVNDGTKRLEHAKYLFQGAAKDWPPMPRLPK
ncbi:MAG TPA: N(4)-(beta-N-acetylglucosaminyl)-L-asparaginase [Candidatus Acidoferrales bacterium]|nr:N(4)-(beta-N-acetylglucosaminyl)-L-asparaginase [Candidatus Acidoferrales bacterium]